MTLFCKFKKEKLDDGSYTLRPKIRVRLFGENISTQIYALLDTGCDVSVIPKSLAESIGIDISGKKGELFGFLEKTDVVESYARIKIVGRSKKESNLIKIPVLIFDNEEDENAVIGLNGIFDNFDINFKKASDRIVFKQAVV